MTETAGGAGADQSGVKQLIDFAGSVLAPAGVVTAVLYYFGFLRERALLAHFGIDLGSVGFSTTDYLVRSAGTLFVPLVVLLLAAVAAVLTHHVLSYVMSRLRPEHQRAVWLALGAVAVALLAVGAVAVYRRADPALGSLIGPVALGGGAVLLQYTADSAGPRLLPDAVSSAVTATRTIRRVATVALVLVSIFWATANIAQRRGGEAARALEKSLPVQAQAVVYSQDRLHITGQGVRVDVLEAADAKYRFRYSGLRMLLHSGGRWFLLPVGWTEENGATVVLLPDDSPDIRVDLAP